MCSLVSLPFSRTEPIEDTLHGVTVTDPYRWLEDQNSPETRAWIIEQTRYARTYLDNIPGRERIRERVRELLDVETYDSFLKARNRYFFRKRRPGQEQPSIYFREGAEGEDQLLIDPASRGTGEYTAVKPIRVSPDGGLLLYEVKRGGEHTGSFEILDVPRRERIPDSLPHGLLRGFSFAPDGKSFYYVHEATERKATSRHTVFHHFLGTASAADTEIFCPGEGEHIRLVLVSGPRTLGFLVYRFLDTMRTDFYLWGSGSTGRPIPVLRDAHYSFSPRLVPGRILAAIDQHTPNRRIVEVQPRKDLNPLYFDLVPEKETPISSWGLTRHHIVVCYTRGADSQVDIADQYGKRVTQISAEAESLRVLSTGLDDDELLLERESFTKPLAIDRYSIDSGRTTPWSSRAVPFDSGGFAYTREHFPSSDETRIPVFLAARRNVLQSGTHPLVMTSYGGYGVSSTPQFSVLTTYLMECGCVFALPAIRGGSEFGAEWHTAAKRLNRQVAFDDFLAAADWLISTRGTNPARLAIFGGSNSGLLVAAAMTQRPDLFCAVLCLVPLLDMLRYHLFDDAILWRDEFGTAENPRDFEALSQYSPYHHVRPGTAYPAIMLVSGGLDTRCNPLHARKMAARLQGATKSSHPVLLDYNELRGHSPVLPIGVRIEALTDRLSFLCNALGVLPG
ncbi:MAG TPA: prolyl oligopeptidase family serine peptidase [Candidatus Acidoferrum sp.]|nr:prolyl oligopeptidase family serine peptidase [Candidatus Acidoferrum sp.]